MYQSERKCIGKACVILYIIQNVHVPLPLYEGKRAPPLVFLILPVQRLYSASLINIFLIKSHIIRHTHHHPSKRAKFARAQIYTNSFMQSHTNAPKNSRPCVLASYTLHTQHKTPTRTKQTEGKPQLHHITIGVYIYT